MNTHTDNTQQNKSHPVAIGSVVDGMSQKQSSGVSTFEFEDNRPEAITQRKLQRMANHSPQAKHTTQLQAMMYEHSTQQQQLVQKKESSESSRIGNNTGLPDNLKTGMENLSGMSLDHVRVHRNSDKPSAVQAHAYAQGSNIHLASGQEKHLPHELGHVVQQAQGRVKPTTTVNGMAVNDNVGLENEADVMGAKALQGKFIGPIEKGFSEERNPEKPIQRTLVIGAAERDSEYIDALNEDVYEDLIGEIPFADVQNFLKGWSTLEEEKQSDTIQIAIGKAVTSIGAFNDDDEHDDDDFTASDFSSQAYHGLYDLLGKEIMQYVAENVTDENLEIIFDDEGLAGVEAFLDEFAGKYAFSGVLSQFTDVQLTDYIDQLGSSSLVRLIKAQNSATVITYCTNLGTNRVAALPDSVNEILLAQPTARYPYLVGQWAALSPYLNSVDNTNLLLQLVAAPYTNVEVATLVGFKTSLADLVYMRARALNAVTLIAFLNFGITQYHQDAAALKPIMNANANAVLGVLTPLVVVLIKGKATISGSEIEALRAAGQANVVYHESIQTLKEQEEGGGTHIYRISFAALTAHEIHIHWNKGQNRKTEYATAHIKPSAYSEIRKSISYDLVKALLPQVP